MCHSTDLLSTGPQSIWNAYLPLSLYREKKFNDSKNNIVFHMKLFWFNDQIFLSALKFSTVLWICWQPKWILAGNFTYNIIASKIIHTSINTCIVIIHYTYATCSIYQTRTLFYNKEYIDQLYICPGKQGYIQWDILVINLYILIIDTY